MTCKHLLDEVSTNSSSAARNAVENTIGNIVNAKGLDITRDIASGVLQATPLLEGVVVAAVQEAKALASLKPGEEPKKRHGRNQNLNDVQLERFSLAATYFRDHPTAEMMSLLGMNKEAPRQDKVRRDNICGDSPDFFIAFGGEKLTSSAEACTRCIRRKRDGMLVVVFISGDETYLVKRREVHITISINIHKNKHNKHRHIRNITDKQT